MYPRLKSFRESLGMTQEEFGKSLNIAKSTYNNYETGVRDPKSDFWIAVAQKYNVTIDYLMGFSDDSHKPTEGEKKAPLYSSEAMKLAQDFDTKLDAWGKRQVRSTADIEIARCAEQAPAAPEVERLVYVNPAAAGSPLYAESDFERLTFPESDVPPGADFGIRISGRSMEPTVPDGCIAWVHKTVDLDDGVVGIFMLNDSATCKRYFKNDDGTFRLESDNPDYGPVEVSEFDTVVPVGKVIGTV